MGTTASSVDIHSPGITLRALRAELRKNPTRLEEKKEGNNWVDPLAGNTLLMSSAELGNVPMCKFLLSVGANIEAKSMVHFLVSFELCGSSFGVAIFG